jgi:hypothetical protein
VTHVRAGDEHSSIRPGVGVAVDPADGSRLAAFVGIEFGSASRTALSRRTTVGVHERSDTLVIAAGHMHEAGAGSDAQR